MPLAHWQPLPGGIPGWSTEFVFAGAMARTVAIPLRSGGVVVWNPGIDVPEPARRELGEMGGVALLLSPNFFHHLGIPSWRKSVGAVPIVAADQARPRLARKLRLAGEEVARLALLEPRLPAGVRLLTPPGVRTGESWLQCEAGDERCWIVGDAFFNIPRSPRTAMGLFLRLLGAAPGLRLSHAFKRIALTDPTGYRDWLLDRLTDAAPTMLLPAHGDVLASRRLGADLRRLVEARL